MSDSEDAWLTPQMDHAPTDYPLQYSAIFSECKPNNGKVSLTKLNEVLGRAGTPNDQSARILALSAEPGSLDVDESHFFWALAHASALQSDVTYPIPETANSSLPAKLNELNLSDEIQTHIFQKELDFNPAKSYSIHVTLHNSDAGSIFTKHSLYSIEGTFKDMQVKCVHRFSDFDNLHQTLVEKFPFRAVPVLPPKRLSFNGKFLVDTSQHQFLLGRAKALQRFLHLIVEHPILSQDASVLQFLMVKPLAADEVEETSFFSILKTRKVVDELENIVADPLFISQWDDSKSKQWQTVQTEMQEQYGHVEQLCSVLSKQHALLTLSRNQLGIMGRSSLALSRSLEQVYPTLQEDLPEIKAKMDTLSSHTTSECNLLDEGAKKIETGPLEQIRLFRQMLSSALDLFSRYKMLSKNTIPEQKKKIENAHRKLSSLATDESPKEEDLHKQRTIIQTAEAEIKSQTNRDWLVKMVMQQEMHLLQSTQYQLSRFIRSFAEATSSSLQERAELAVKLKDEVSQVPLEHSN